MQKGFSLVELSIVLVILGLLTGGILAGQNLIRASELRALSSELDRYLTSTHTFRDKYFAIPGDMQNATKFWNRLNTNADCVSNHGLSSAGTPGTCDGNGDGKIRASAASQAAETYTFWQQLAYAGLIEGSYTGIAGSSNLGHHIGGENAPASKLGNSCWSVAYWGTNTGTGGIFPGDYNHIIFMGGNTTSYCGSIDGSEPLTPAEAWSIDTKRDDGNPAYGRVRSMDTTARPDCVTTDDPATTEYKLQNDAKDCQPVYISGF